MRAGTLDRKIIIHEKSVEQDSFGAEVITWVTFRTVWTNVKYNVGRKPLLEGQPVASVPIQFRIRYLDGLKTEMRISYEGKLFDITSINEYGRRETLSIDATATVE